MQRTKDPRKRPAPSPVSDPRQKLEDIFNWNPLPVTSNKSKSTGTRQPAPYDRHMDERLRLKGVVYAPHMLDNIPDCVDEYLRMRTLPTHKKSGLIRLKAMATTDRETCRTFTLESEVVTRYSSVIANPLIRIASTLALGLPDWQSSYFVWSPVSKTNDFAVGDGFLRASPSSHNNEAPPIDAETRRKLRSLEENFPNLGVWEFKSALSGPGNFDSDTRVKNIVTFAQAGIEFEWIGCSSTFCGTHYQPDGSPTVTGARVGFDARTRRCTLPEDPQNRASSQSNNYKHTAGTVYIIQQVMSLKYPGDIDIHVFVAQMWAEAVREDATFIVLHSGNFEAVCFRDRSKNTLYVSPLINVTQFPGYGKLQIGLYLTMYLDAVDRNDLIVAAVLTKTAPTTWFRRYNVFTAAEKNARNKTKGKMKATNTPVRSTNVCFFGPCIPDFKFDNKFFQDIAADAHVLPALTLIRKPVKQQNNIFAGTFRFDRVGCDPANTAVPPMQLDLRNEVDTLVYAAALKVHSLTLDRELVVKVALNKGDCKRLLHEISLYERLGKTVEGMPDVFGGFICSSDNPNTRMVILVMRKHGISLQSDEFTRLTSLDR
jgi:hypothetical protein